MRAKFILFLLVGCGSSNQVPEILERCSLEYTPIGEQVTVRVTHDDVEGTVAVFSAEHCEAHSVAFPAATENREGICEMVVGITEPGILCSELNYTIYAKTF